MAIFDADRGWKSRFLLAALPLTLLLLPVQAPAWESDANNDISLECKGWPLDGADRLVVRVFTNNGSAGPPRLAALKGKDAIWSTAFPQVTDVNVAKAWTRCSMAKDRKSVAIELWDSNPGDPAWYQYRYRWDGKKLKFLGQRLKK